MISEFRFTRRITRGALLAGVGACAVLAERVNAQFHDVKSYINSANVVQPPPAPLQGNCASGCQVTLDQTPNLISGVYSEVNCNALGGLPQVALEDFVLSAATGICDVALRGGYHPTNTPPTNDTFHVWIYSDAAGCPDYSDVQYADLPVTSTRIWSGIWYFGVQVYEYTITLSPVLLPAGTYWITIYNDTVSTPDDWFWETGDFDANGAAYTKLGLDNSAPPQFCGSLFVYDLALRICVPGGDIGTKYCIATNNSTGSPADISATGSASSFAGVLRLTSTPVPNQNGIFFHGSNQAQVPFGNGFLCATGGIARSAVTLGSGNEATYTYNNSDAKHSLAPFIGTQRNFQHWFRDPMGGGAQFNTSNALSVDILP